MGEVRDFNGGRRGPLWKPGQSGNPTGSNMTPEVRKQLYEARKLCAENAQKAIAKLLQLMDCGKPEVERGAANDILDRAGLKAVAIDVETTEETEQGDKVIRVRFVDGTNAA